MKIELDEKEDELEVEWNEGKSIVELLFNPDETLLFIGKLRLRVSFEKWILQVEDRGKYYRDWQTIAEGTNDGKLLVPDITRLAERDAEGRLWVPERPPKID